MFSSSICFLSRALLLTLQLRTEIYFTIFSPAHSPNASNGFEISFQSIGTLLPEEMSINGMCRQVHWQSVTKSEDSLKFGHISWQDMAIILMASQSLTDCTRNLEKWMEKGGK